MSCRPYIYKEIKRAIKINKNNIGKECGRNIGDNNIKFLEKDYDDLRKFILKLLKEDD